jgi:cytochrome c-type biogenesis protein CcmH/NrfG
MLGRVWSQSGKPGPARQAYRLARDLDPKNPEPPFALAELALAGGDPAGARGHLQQVLELAPAHRRALGLWEQLVQSGGACGIA